ncbi:hypothetical protein BH20ACI4_BH20ACI4_00170 [soil metagenome]
MDRYYTNNKYTVRNERGIKLLPVLILFGFVFLSGLIFLILTTDNFEFLERPYLLPWVILAAVVFVIPGIYLGYKNKFQLYHPLVFPVLFYFLPSFFVGGIILMLGLNEPYFMSFVQDQEYNLPLTMVIVILGFAGLTAGFFIPIGGKVGQIISRFLPDWKWDDDNVIFPGLFLLILGFLNNILGFFVGVIGYQKIEETGSYDGLIFLTTLLWIQGSFMLWVALFRRNRWNFKALAIVALLVATSLLKAVFAGNRGGLLQIFILILLSYVFAGRIIKLKQAVVLGVAMVVVVIVGMIYGTTFRQVKGSEEQIESSRYVENISKTFDTIGEKGPGKILEQSFFSLSERLEAVSSLAVVVSNYEQLKPYEESYGIDNNIYKDTVTFIVPRIFWKDKPVASEPRRYSELYFNYGENSFTITPMGDLVRNFGVVGVPLGMLLLGFIVRILYAALIENQPFSYWRSVLFFMLVPSISYESFYGSIIPYMFKVGFITVVGIVMTQFLINKVSRKV